MCRRWRIRRSRRYQERGARRKTCETEDEGGTRNQGRKTEDEKKLKEEQSEDKKQTRGERCQDRKQMARAERRKNMRINKNGFKWTTETLPEKPRCPLRFWRTVALVDSFFFSWFPRDKTPAVVTTPGLHRYA
ncbi:hypothetical protein NDU88_008492 [Pleurodeles waltl]|uniref:Uncharacterized protein n=1 Tax=Pleurodeles waltl TaxID=8319 RepID=A0AAV7PRR4_PLEWA|nr:hypothetical protein NDU88_008492 [Pleurodeles waltl]